LTNDEAADLDQLYAMENKGNIMDIEDLVEAGQKFR
jgi:hypothetical protein